MRPHLAAVFKHGDVLSNRAAGELLTTLIRLFPRLRFERFCRIRNVGRVVANEVLAVNLYYNILVVEEPALSRPAFAAKINSEISNGSATLDKFIAYGRGDSTTELPLGLLPTVVNIHLGGLLEAKTVSFCKNKIATISTKQITNGMASGRS